MACTHRSAGASGGVFSFHASKKASPMFLLTLPPYWEVAKWTRPPTWFTNTITCACKHSVVSVNCRMSQKPNTAVIILPSSSGFNAPLFRFWLMISAPASPKPICSRPLTLVSVFSSS